LKPKYRLHAPFGSEPLNFFIIGMVGFFVVFLGLDLALHYGSIDTTESERVIISLGAAVLWALACGALGWASAKRTEVLSDDGVPRYEKWRRRVLGWAGAVILGIVGTAIYSFASG
jgi:hypothetical protein